MISIFQKNVFFLKELANISKIAQSGCEMLENAEIISLTKFTNFVGHLGRKW